MESKNENSFSRESVVICDWGSSHLRAYLVDGNGEVLKRYESSQGAKSLSGNKAAYRDELHAALEALDMGVDSEIRISGMAGSKLGWREVGYRATLLTKEDFSANYLPLEDFPNARLFGGVMHQNEDGPPDVMRGEEVQIFGIIGAHPDARLICLPGTHSKWVVVEDGKIISLKTFMTGDLFHSLCEGSIFREQITSMEFHRNGFLKGCRLADAGNGLQDLFKLRSAFVFAKISSEEFSSCLSGFLIANEIRSAPRAKSGVHLCGSSTLMPLYALAMEQAGIVSHAFDGEAATIAGHLSLTSL